MLLKVEIHDQGVTKIIDYPGDVKMFLWVHSFGRNIKNIKRGTYCIINPITGAPDITVSKPGKREIAAYEKECVNNEH